jgi:hypothetical protein
MAHIPRQSYADALSQERGWSRCIEIGITRLGRAFPWCMQENLVQLRRLLNVHGHAYHMHNLHPEHTQREMTYQMFFHRGVWSAGTVMLAPPNLPPCAQPSVLAQEAFFLLIFNAF